MVVVVVVMVVIVRHAAKLGATEALREEGA